MSRRALVVVAAQEQVDELPGGRRRVEGSVHDVLAHGRHRRFHVRVGLEDSIWIGRGKLAASNAEQVRKIRSILEELGHEIATPAEAREILNLKGADKVNF